MADQDQIDTLIAYYEHWKARAEKAEAERDRYMAALLELEDRLMLPPAETHADVIFHCCSVVQAALEQGAKIREGK